MLTGRQVRQARALLHLHRSKLAERVGMPTAMLKLAEAVDGECPITVERNVQIRRVLVASGIEFMTEDDGTPGVRLKMGA